MRNKVVLFIASVVFFTACVETTGISPINGKRLKKNELLTSNSSIYLANGGDGMMETYFSEITKEEVAKGSGVSALNIAFKQLRMKTARVVSSKTVTTEMNALKSSKLNKSDYLIYSRVERWTDPLGINCNQYYKDEASVLVSLYSVKDKKLLNTSRLSANDCPFSVNGLPVQLGSPEILYEKLFTNWINNTFQKK
jgi:hypothetical protein